MPSAFEILTEGINFAVGGTLDLQAHYQTPLPPELGEYIRTGKMSSLASLLSFQSAGTLKSVCANSLCIPILCHQHAVHLIMFFNIYSSLRSIWGMADTNA